MKYLLILIVILVAGLVGSASTLLLQTKTTCKQYADGNLIGEYSEITISMSDGVVFEVCK